jgi:hypothetical protein
MFDIEISFPAISQSLRPTAVTRTLAERVSATTETLATVRTPEPEGTRTPACRDTNNRDPAIEGTQASSETATTTRNPTTEGTTEGTQETHGYNYRFSNCNSNRHACNSSDVKESIEVSNSRTLEITGMSGKARTHPSGHNINSRVYSYSWDPAKTRTLVTAQVQGRHWASEVAGTPATATAASASLTSARAESLTLAGDQQDHGTPAIARKQAMTKDSRQLSLG